MQKRNTYSDLIDYLANNGGQRRDGDRLPTLNELSEVLETGMSRLREQLEVARALGFVEVRPRIGIRRLPYSFLPAVRQSLRYAIELDPKHFDYFSDLRSHIEAAYWREAAGRLTPEDHAHLQELMQRAWGKLRGHPIQIPHAEHRELHLSIYSRLSNPFVLGILEAYWEAYEAVGLNLYADYSYLEKVWEYHQKMVDAICSGDLAAGYQAFVEHVGLLRDRPPARSGGEGDNDHGQPQVGPGDGPASAPRFRDH